MGKRKGLVERIEKDRERMVTFSKRKTGLFNKAMELSTRTGAQTAVTIVSEAGVPHATGDLSVLNRFLGISSNETQKVGGEAFVVSSPDERKNSDGSSSSSLSEFSELLNAEVHECDRIDELLALKENLEEMRNKISLEMDLRFADSLIA